MLNNLKNNNPVAVKYNGNQLDKHNTCSFDFMVFNYAGKPRLERINSRIKIELQPYGTQVFEKVAKVFIDDIVFFSMVWQPRNHNLGENLVQIKLENHLLYRMELKEVQKWLEWFTCEIGVKYSGVSRLDVCADFQNGGDFFRDMIKQIIIEDVLISGREKRVKIFNEVTGVYGKTKRGKIKFNGFSIGKKSSMKFLRIYNKSLEMEEVKYKHHIAQHWKREGFTDLSDVWRFEYSLDSRFMREYNVQFEDIFNDDFITMLLKTAYNNHFELKANTGKKEINKEKTVYKFDFSRVTRAVKVLEKVVEDIKETVQKSVVSIKRQIKGLYRSYYSTNEQDFYNAIGLHLNSYDLRDWFELKKESYLQEFYKETLIINRQIA